MELQPRLALMSLPILLVHGLISLREHKLMIYSNITTATTTQVYTPPTLGTTSFGVKRVLVTVNATSTGAVTVVDSATTTTPVVATIAAPAQGASYEYWGLQTGVRIITAASCDITVSVDLSTPASR